LPYQNPTIFMRKFTVSCLAIFYTIGLFGCGSTPKPSSSTTNTTTNKYTEDLTAYRQKFPAPPSISPIPATPTTPTPPNNTSNGTNSTTTNATNGNGNPPTQHQNAAMDSLLTALYEANKSVKSVQGYRILVYSGTDREEAERVKGTLDVKLQERSEMGYDKPNFKVRVGSFVQRLEAYKTLVKVHKEFPNAILVIDKINIEARRRR
jgi:hypothetical protein